MKPQPADFSQGMVLLTKTIAEHGPEYSGPVDELYYLEDGDGTVAMTRQQFLRMIEIGQTLLQLGAIPTTEVRFYATR